MRHKKTAAALSLMSLSALLAACDVITAQHIPSSTTTAFNNGAGLGGRGAQMGMPGSFANGGGLGNVIDDVVEEAFDADLIGRIVKVEGRTIQLERVEHGNGAQGDGARSPGGADDGQMEWTPTGESLTFTLGSDVKISSFDASPSRRNGRPEGGQDRGRGGGEATGSVDSSGRSGGDAGIGNSASPAGGEIADLKASQIVLVWYKEGTKTVDRIRILQDVSE